MARGSPSHATEFRTISVDGLKVFYREAGPPGAPTVLLLHGFPSSSRMYNSTVADAHAYQRDVPGAQVHILDAGHFALDEAPAEIAARTRRFLTSHLFAADEATEFLAADTP